MGIFDIFSGAPAQDAAQKNALLYQQYGQQAQDAINRGEMQGADAYNKGIAAYTPLSNLGSKYGGATSLQLDALGVNGPGGTARAQSAFQASPGYQWNVDQALNQISRQRNAIGGLDSGNTWTALQDRASNLANQEYGNWLGNLGNYISPELSATGGAASGQAAGYNALGGMYGANALNRSNVFGNVASGTANSNQQAAQSQMQGSAAFWNALSNLGGTVAKAKFG